MQGGAYPKKTLDGAGELREVARVCYDSCVDCLSGALLAGVRPIPFGNGRWPDGFGWGLCRGEDLGDSFQRGFGFVRPENFQSVFGLFNSSDFQHGASESLFTDESVEGGGSYKIEKSSPFRSVDFTGCPKRNHAPDCLCFMAAHEFGQSLYPWAFP
jgi:hypothetical protein